MDIRSQVALATGGASGLGLATAESLLAAGGKVVIVDLAGSAGEEVAARLGEQVPHPSRLGEPEEYASLAEHIVSNPMLNAEAIRHAGAIRMGPK